MPLFNVKHDNGDDDGTFNGTRKQPQCVGVSQDQHKGSFQNSHALTPLLLMMTMKNMRI